MRFGLVIASAALAFWLAVPALAEAQVGAVSGRVLTDDGSPVAGAQVSVVGTGRGAVTNVRGAFSIRNVPAGTHTLQVQSLGYSTTEVSVSIPAGETVTQNLRITPEAVAVEAIHVTVGSRTAITAADELVVPVDVYTRAELQLASPQLEMATILNEVSPSVYFPRSQIADLTSGVRPFQLRGLSPDHSLVLVNGKRRHSTAVVHVFGQASGGSGSSGVDMNALVPASLAGMEILRDGAAAQYGSDAIAGVVNVQLRDDVHRPEFSVTVGQYRPSDFDADGERVELAGSWGFELGEGRGTAVLSGMYSHREPTERAGADPRDQIVEGDADVTARNSAGILEVVEKRNAAPQPNHRIGDGRTDNVGFFLNTNYDLTGDGLHTFYAFGGYSWRRDLHSGFYRRGIDNRNWPEIHPLGFLPHFRGDAQDMQAVLGVEGFMGDWGYDFSGQFNRNRFDTDIFRTHNVSLGPCLDVPCAPGPFLDPFGNPIDPIPNKTDVYAGGVANNQAILSADLVREFDVDGLASPLNVAVGSSFRADNFVLDAGEPASWVDGRHPDRAGGRAPPGSQVFTGFRPDQEVSEWRTNIGLYADLEADLTSAFRLAAAGRFENYSDFGSTVTGKLATRIQPADQFILRGSVSTGFRAPNLNQSYYSHVSTGFRAELDEDGNPTGNQIAYEIGEIPVESPEARALGAEPLKEETSVNLTAGMAFSPTEHLTVTVDGYQIDVDDRIILTGSLSGPTVEELLAPFGAPTVKFFTNSIDTRTRGLDISVRYRQLLGGERYVEFLGQFNRNLVKVRNVQVPQVIEEIRDQVFGSGDRFVLENGRPRNRTTIRTRFVQGGLTASLSANQYGTQWVRLSEGVGGEPDFLFDTGGEAVFNGSLSYDINDHFGIALGAENLTNKRPNVRPDGFDFLGIFPFYSTSGLNINGRYVYARVNVKL
jgi:iron complex outermembrane recepter protein